MKKKVGLWQTCFFYEKKRKKEYKKSIKRVCIQGILPCFFRIPVMRQRVFSVPFFRYGIHSTTLIVNDSESTELLEHYSESFC